MQVILNIFNLSRCFCWLFRFGLRLGYSFVSPLSFNSNTLDISFAQLLGALFNDCNFPKFLWPINWINLVNNSCLIPLPIYLILKQSFNITLNHFTFVIGLNVHQFKPIFLLQQLCWSLPIKHIIEFFTKSAIRIFLDHIQDGYHNGFAQSFIF